MQDMDASQQQGDADEATSDEASMRRALERLGPRPGPAHRATGNGASAMATSNRATPRSRPGFVRDGDVPVVRVAAAARRPGETERELVKERAARLRAEEALTDA